jgi:dUTP pyrophosphatase
MIIRFKKVYDDAIIPTFGHGDEGNAGFDFYAHLKKPVIVWPLFSAQIGTGVAWEPFLPTCERRQYKVAMLLRGRSGVTKNGLQVSGGTIDAGYRGEIKIHVRCMRLLPWIIQPGMRVAQGITIQIPHIDIVESNILNDAERGDRGFGSSGK